MKLVRSLGFLWAVVGITGLLASAIGRLLPHALDALRIGLSGLQWIILGLWVIFMLVAEGYRGFQKQFAPRVAGRMWHLARHGRPLDLLLAPLYAVGYYAAPRRRIITSWSITAGIVMLIVIVRQFSQPWRGIIDWGVVLGLAYGLAAVYVCTYQKRYETVNITTLTK